MRSERWNKRRRRELTARVIGIGVAAVALAVSGCGGGEGDGGGGSIPKTTLQLGTSAVPTQLIGKAIDKFATSASQLSDGQVEIKVHGGGSLCSEDVCLRSVKDGTLDIGTASDSNYLPFTSKLTLVGLPYAWKSQDSQNQVFRGQFGDRLKQDIASDDGLQLLAMFDNGGFRQLWNSVREVRTPEQLGGLKLRSSASKVELAIDRSWGGAPVVMNWGDVYSALQQGVVKGELNQPNWIRDYKHAEVLKHVTLVNAQIGYHILSMSTEKWESLPKSVQEVLLKAGRKAEEWLTPENQKDVAAALEQVREGGVDVYEPTADELKEWVSKAITVWQQFGDTVPADQLQGVLKAQGCPMTGCIPEVDYHVSG
jgi:tripartite ATP-independent transporter DctP family solute receptor